MPQDRAIDTAYGLDTPHVLPSMTRKKNASSPPKSDAAPLPPPLDPSLLHDQPAGSFTSTSDAEQVGGNAEQVHSRDVLHSADQIAFPQSLPPSQPSPPVHPAPTENKPVRSASVIAAETAKRRENNFLEKLWNWLDSDISHGIMEFSVNGRYLLILDPDAVPEALDTANICKHKNYGSFQRQCCIYGWRRIPQIEVHKLVLDDDEEPGATISRLGDNIKVMQHENLVRDSPREEVRSVTRKAKPKPSRAKDAEARAIANERMAAEQAEREARQQKQAELVALHRQEEKNRQEEQKRREHMKQQQEEDQVNMDLTYDPALPPAPPMASSIALDPSLADLTGSSPVPANTLSATPTISKQANSNTTKKSKGTSKKRKHAAGTDRDENQENIYDTSHNNGDIRINEEMAKRAKKKQQEQPAPSSTTVTFDNDAVLSSLGANNDPFATLTLDHQTSTESASASFDKFFANAFDPSRFTSGPPPGMPASLSSDSQLVLPNSGSTQYNALPKSLQDAFLVLDKNSAGQSNGITSSSSATPTQAQDSIANQALNMIDPALTNANFNESTLPPLPPAASLSQTMQGYSNNSGVSGTLPIPQHQASSTFPGLTGLSVNYGVASSTLPSSAGISSTLNQPNNFTSMAQPFYYQPSSIDAFSDPTYDPNLPPNNALPPYFSSAFSGLADLQATNW